jgi:hypothetical protein
MITTETGIKSRVRGQGSEVRAFGISNLKYAISDFKYYLAANPWPPGP